VVNATKWCCGLSAVLWIAMGLEATGQAPSQLPWSDVPYSAIPGPAPLEPGPTATFEGTIQPPPPSFDPYAPPGTTPPTLLPRDPFLQPGSIPPVDGFYTKMTRFFQEARLDYVWMPGDSVEELGVNDIELSGTFAVPFFYNTETPLLITPGFAINYWSGPRGVAADLPARTFDAYLDTAWNPQPAPFLGAELAFRIGVYSDFKRVSNESIRYMGRGLMVLAFSPSCRIKAGIEYLDRNRVKILPAGGIVWTPNPDICFELVFPRPKITRRFWNVGNSQWWGYLRGEYGGGAWTVGRVAGFRDSFDYNDLRFALGLECRRDAGLGGLFEVGYSFEREIRYRSKLPEVFRPNTTVFLRGGLIY